LIGQHSDYINHQTEGVFALFFGVWCSPQFGGINLINGTNSLRTATVLQCSIFHHYLDQVILK